MGQCNYCSLKEIRKRNSGSTLKLTLRQARGGLGGTDVYKHPKGMDIEQLTNKQREKYFIAWFMKIGDSCECD